MSLGTTKRRVIQIKAPEVKRNLVRLPFLKQKKPNWCWAACIEMVLHAQQAGELEQCEIANRYFDSPLRGTRARARAPRRCCQAGRRKPNLPDPCDQQCFVSDIRGLFDLCGVITVFRRRKLSFKRIQAEIDAGRPVAVGVSFINGGGHMVVIHGWEIVAENQRVHVADPRRGHTIFLYDELVNFRGLGEWDSTWADFAGAAEVVATKP